MPQFNEVNNLQSLALACVSKYILDNTSEIKKDINGMREYFLNNVHAWARTNILACTKSLLYCGKTECESWYEFSGIHGANICIKPSGHLLRKWLVVMNIMLDVGVYQLPHLDLHGTMENELNQYVSTLRRCNARLKEFSVHLQMFSKNDYTPGVFTSMYILQMSLQEGLASRLVCLRLNVICDNAILKTVGKYASCLKYFDLTGSWNVDEEGIKNLLFKDEACMEIKNLSNKKLCQHLSQAYDNKLMLNDCCFTLEDLRIQDTNTEDASLLMILACVKSLKALGGFLYFRNIGDALVTVWKNSPKPRIFQLTELFDMQLTGKKIAVLKECLPHLNRLYTRLSCVCTPRDFENPEQGLMFWGRVRILTIDLDYMMNFHFTNFLRNYGRNLSELSILDQEADIDVARVVENCPNLLVLKGYLHVFEIPFGKFTKLKSIELHMPTVETINWFFDNCPCLEEAKLFSDSRHLYWNTQFFEKPPIVMCDNLKILEISFNNEDSVIDHQTVIKFIDKCSKLQYLGQLNKWNLDQKFVNQVKTYIREKNYMLEIY